MCIISFKKKADKQNNLFDEFFSEYNQIDIVSFNYDAQGTALCECDGTLTALDAHRLDKILFGVHKLSLENYLKSIFDPTAQSDEIHRTGKEMIFKLPELSKLKKYDLFNLAKKTLKEVQDSDCDIFFYFEEQKGGKGHGKGKCCSSKKSTVSLPATQLYGNISSKIIHKTTCKSYNPATCTAVFADLAAAEKAGYKPCGQCKP